MIQRHPEMVDLLVAVGNDRTAVDAGRREARQLVAPTALLRRGGFRRYVNESDLRTLAVPTTVMWGNRDPVGTVDAAASVVDMIPNAELCAFDAGHVRWFDDACAVAALIGRIATHHPEGPSNPDA